jgi:hypothetical protein
MLDALALPALETYFDIPAEVSSHLWKIHIQIFDFGFGEGRFQVVV